MSRWAVYAAGRAAGAAAALVGAASLLFSVLHVVGGDPALMLAGRNATAGRIEEIRATLGISSPWHAQFGAFLAQIATGDFGRSLSSGREIRPMILEAAVPSLSMAALAVAATAFLACAIGLAAASRRGSWFDRGMIAASVLGSSVPILALILSAQYLLAFRLGWFPVAGYDGREYLVLPVMVLVAAGMGRDSRIARSALVDELAREHIRAARARGVPEWEVLWRHALRGASAPLVALMAAELPELCFGMFVVEAFFGIPGLGGITIEALRSGDFPLLRAMGVVNAAVLIAMSLLSDLLVAWLDPRARASWGG